MHLEFSCGSASAASCSKDDCNARMSNGVDDCMAVKRSIRCTRYLVGTLVAMQMKFVGNSNVGGHGSESKLVVLWALPCPSPLSPRHSR